MGCGGAYQCTGSFAVLSPGAYTASMHDPASTDQAFFKCDFCFKPWADDRPMVEGHHGSLICASCLTVAYTEIIINESPSVPSVASCSLCLEERDQPGWQSPMTDAAVICLRCVKQSATVLEKDEDQDWNKPSVTPA
jgi:hypothetical protein